MTLPASGSISMSQVLTELRIAAPSRNYPLSLTDSDVRALAGVPSGNISMSDLYSRGVVNPIPAIYLESSAAAPTNPSAGVVLGNNGTVSVSGTLSTSAGNWHNPTLTGIGASYYARVSLVTGSTNPTTGTLNVWSLISVNNTWIWSRNTAGVTSVTIKIEIATDAAGTNIVATESSIVVIVERT